jgi:hypothetical protein
MDQSTNHILMIEPTRFYSNPETLEDNHFQSEKLVDSGTDSSDIQKASEMAKLEFSKLQEKLKAAGLKLTVFRDLDQENSPDSIFPNNWFSTHSNQELVLYPMRSALRRKERRSDIIAELTKAYPTVLDLTRHETYSCFLEGTGSIVLDRPNRQAYCALSPRSDLNLFKRWCDYLGFQPHAFSSSDPQGRPVYHTNVIMAIGTSWAVVCLEAIGNSDERTRVLEMLRSSEKEIVEITWHQVEAFCGNILEVRDGSNLPRTVMSSSAWQHFSVAQQALLEKIGNPIISDISTIERLGGGGVRCMLAELF